MKKLTWVAKSLFVGLLGLLVVGGFNCQSKHCTCQKGSCAEGQVCRFDPPGSNCGIGCFPKETSSQDGGEKASEQDLREGAPELAPDVNPLFKCGNLQCTKGKEYCKTWGSSAGCSLKPDKDGKCPNGKEPFDCGNMEGMSCPGEDRFECAALPQNCNSCQCIEKDSCACEKKQSGNIQLDCPGS